MRDLSEIKYDGRKVSEIIEDDEPNLRNANLRGADLQDADLRDADFRGVDLRGVDLRNADFRDADLRSVDLRYVDLHKADLRGVDLQNADLRGADLQNTKLPDYERLPENSSFVAYKGCKGNVVKLEIPKGAERTSSLIGPKCRAECAEVLEVLDENGEPCDDTKTVSWYDESFEYVEGETVYPDEWDDDIRVECTNGIHIYPTLDEAIETVR